MGEVFASEDPTSLVRKHEANPSGLGKMNVVVLVQESLGAQFVGAYGDTRGLTPFLDTLSQESLMFSNAYATGTRTVRGLEAMSASFPPIPSESIVKRRGSDHISNWGAVMRGHGYSTSFLYGGYGAFDSMNAYFAGNDFACSDRLNIKNPQFGNIWGVSDEDLYRHAVGYFDGLAAAGKGPFFSFVLSTSNHKPFTFPPGIPGVPESGGGRLAGVRYADYAIGKFFEMAKTRPWFSNTIVVVIADHDSRVYGRAYVPVDRFRIPVLVYAPGKIAPQKVEKYFSSLDLGPTILGLLGLPYEAPFYGVDALKASTPSVRPVTFSHNHNIAIYAEGNLTVLGLNKEARSFRYENGKTSDAPLDQHAADLLTATLQTAYEKFTEHSY
jgi:phosphoglycerol transferase MdoB-like AlkP superfamily enzyme